MSFCLYPKNSIDNLKRRFALFHFLVIIFVEIYLVLLKKGQNKLIYKSLVLMDSVQNMMLTMMSVGWLVPELAELSR